MTSLIKGLFLTLALSLASYSTSLYAITVSEVGDAFAIDFNGVIDGSEIEGLSAHAIVKLVGIENGNEEWTFTVSLSNTSGGGIEESRISAFAFNVDQQLDISNSAVSGLYTTIKSNKTLPGAGKKDFCVQNSADKCANSEGGASQGETGEFTFTLNVGPSSPQELELTDFAIRYLSIHGKVCKDGTGFGNVTPVPLPAGLPLYSLALLGLGIVKRRKQQT